MNIKQIHFDNIRTNLNKQTELKVNIIDTLNALIRGESIPEYKTYSSLDSTKMNQYNSKVNLLFKP